MATINSDSVTIDRAYFETLVRRANLAQNGDLTSNPLSGNYDPALSVIPKTEYEGLLLMSKQYSNLWRNLMAGGVDEETLSLLSESDVATPQHNSQTSTTIPLYKSEESEDGDVQLGPSLRWSDGSKSYPSAHGVQGPRSYGGGGRNVYHNGSHAERQTGKPSGWADSDSMGDDYMSVQFTDSRAKPDSSNERPYGSGLVQNHQRPQYPRLCRRTVVFNNLPENATHKDITDVVRGGMLLDVFLRATEHVAQVSFLREEDAVRFYDHVRKNDVYIRNKRVSLRWAEKHFHLPGHVAGKVALGATRNMVIRRCDPKHTQDSIRDDLEHIHNLVVIDVEFVGGSCYIKTNSVHNAMFARTCMMSRAYKGSKIEWGVDECDQPIESIQRASPKPPQAPPLKKPQASMRNRFATLRLDDDDDETDDTLDSSSEFRSPSTVNVIV